MRGLDNKWGYMAVVLGFWEAAAFQGRIPTISRVCWRAQERFGKRAQLLILLWMLGLGKHLIQIGGKGGH